MRVYSDNCGVCGREFASTELTKTSLGGYLCNLQICASCSAIKKIAEDFREAAELISKSFSKKK